MADLFPHAPQYALVHSARGALLDYCATLRPADLLAPVPAFNHSSMRDLLVHVARTYQYWLGQVGLQRPGPLPYPPDAPDLAALRGLFAAVDALVDEFGAHVAGRWLEEAPYALPPAGRPLPLTPLQLFTHVITHEFHHKGQVLSMSRQLGYTPIDTDVIRT
ncbi:DinB family protein [Hymenobacter gummosus]|nr:DinB family protein [Hymenobacter gummosus]